MRRYLSLIAILVLANITMGDAASPILVPSDVKIVGLTAKPSKYQREAVESWKNFPSYTTQTLENFQNGTPRGVLCVHSYEVICGVIPHFIQKWNAAHPDDHRSWDNKSYDVDEKFFNIFTPREFVDHYVEYVLAHRPLISTSVLSFHEEAVYSNFTTFGLVSLILSVPFECVATTSFRDAYTKVDYLSQPFSWNLNEYPEYLSNTTLYTLDSLIRFSNVQKFYDLEDRRPAYQKSKLFSPHMNEVAVLSCAISTGYKRPSVMGVLINSQEGAASYLGNVFHAQHLEFAARTWALQNELPIIELSSLKRCIFSAEELAKPVGEWSALRTAEGPKNFLTSYVERDDQREHDYIAEGFRLTAEQLNGYGLSPIPGR